MKKKSEKLKRQILSGGVLIAIEYLRKAKPASALLVLEDLKKEMYGDDEQ